ncbi:hypothetical protein [Paenibacillus cremeus]|uniref:TerB family tellurite resistance protein n=1 Tax=Paenibacillus cremeus TaxID=2163881 RepID=A0A559K8E1_9BACL|nr:hypothetical protein [Paenibacillus cremeus]TVY08353.1 hypothetical protein FPZ49_19090 [Paenibacillus cremeus]
MFLNRLTTNEKKEAFLELAHLIALSNGIITVEEEKLLVQYRNEMYLNNEYQFKNLALNEIVPVFDDEQTKKAVFIEALSLVFVDGNYDDEEKLTIKQLQESFNFSEAQYQECKDWVKKVNAIYEEGYKLVYA